MSLTKVTFSEVTLSVVSHGQGDLVADLLCSLDRLNRQTDIQVILTLNIPESLLFHADSFSFPLSIYHNRRVAGYGANHNAAFLLSRSPYFCVLNPDILFQDDPFLHLLAVLQDETIGCVSPALVDSEGRPQDNGRCFPSLVQLARRRLFHQDEFVVIPGTESLLYPDWLAGMFLFFPATVFRNSGGFDENYFMYCEDTDICFRLRRAGQRVALCPAVTAVHNPRRASHRTILHFWWHVSSMIRFLGRQILSRPMSGSLSTQFP